MTAEPGTQESSSAHLDTTIDPPVLPSRLEALKALGKKVAGAVGKTTNLYKQVVEEALRVRADCPAEDDIRRLFEEARQAGLIKRPPRRFDPAMITPLIIDAVFSEVKSGVGDSTRSRLIRIVDYTFEKGGTLDELIEEHKGLWNIYGAWRRDKAAEQVTTLSSTITIQLVIDRAFGETIRAGEIEPRLVWNNAMHAFVLEPLSGPVSIKCSADASIKGVYANENLTAADDTVVSAKVSDLTTALVEEGGESDDAAELVGEEERTPEEAELLAATDTYLGRWITIGSLGGGLSW